MAQGGAQGGEGLEVAGMGEGFGQVVFLGGGDPVGQTCVLGNGFPQMGDEVIAGQSQDRHTHPEGVDTDGATGIGEGVEGDVDAVMGGEVLGSGGRPFQGEALRRDAMLCEARLGLLGDGGIEQGMGFEEQACRGELLEQACPEGNDPIVEFGDVVEATEGDIAVDEGRQG